MAEPTDWERTARELAQVCEAQEAEIARLRADAELGAMVRRMPLGTGLFPADPPEFAWQLWDGTDRLLGMGNTPDAALRAAGLG